MFTTVGKRFTFEAAHKLPEHEGKCQNVHGHSYLVEVTVSGYPDAAGSGSSAGMVLDFGVLSELWKSRLDSILDHQFLNDSLPGEYQPPTAENVAAFIFTDFANFLVQKGFNHIGCTVWETETSWAAVGS